MGSNALLLIIVQRLWQGLSEDLVYIHLHLDEIRSAVTIIKEKRLLEALKDQGIMRAHDELQRSADTHSMHCRRRSKKTSDVCRYG
jgi:hypothetical protein